MTQESIKVLTKEQLYDKNTLLEIFQEKYESDKELLLIALEARAEELRCKTDISKLIKAFKRDAKEIARSNHQNNITMFGHINGELNCGNWIADNNGIRILTFLGEKIACYHPILPVERLFNIETKTEKITLAYLRDDEWKEITVDKGLIASSTKIVKLADYGVAVTSESSKAMVQFLCDIENMNQIPIKNSTSKFGWHGEEFIPFDRSIVFDDESRFKELTESLKERGSYDIWLDMARKIRKNKKHYEPQLYMAASFASVLLKKLNMLPFIVNLWGSTGTGKTVALMLAASIWANPSENKYITDSYSTQNAFEIRLDILNHLPLMMDDLSKVRDKLNDNFTDLIYLLCSGKGKDRSNVDLGLNKVKTWQCTILSNMERPLAAETMRGGAINRILDFEMQDGYIFESGNAVVEILSDNYGFAGPRFVDYLKDIPYETLQIKRREFEKLIKEEAEKQGSVKEEKQILPLSVLLLADKIATDLIFDDGIYLDIPTMVANLKDVNEVSEGRRAYDTIIDYVKVNINRFSDVNNVGECWGFIEDCYVNINPAVLKNIATRENFSVKAFCSWAKKENLLKSNNDRSQNVIKRNGHATRFYTIRLEPEEKEPETLENTDEDGFQDATQMQLPFD